MQGFLHKLFLQKWDQFGWKIHYGMRLLDAIYLGLLGSLVFHMKQDPTGTSKHVQPSLLLLSMAPIVEEDVRGPRPTDPSPNDPSPTPSQFSCRALALHLFS